MFTVLSAVYNNYILSLGRSRMLVVSELLRDGVALAALVPTLGALALESPGDPTLGIRIFLWGQIGASAVGCGATLVIAAHHVGRPWWRMAADSLPYIPLTLAAMAAAWWLPQLLGLASPLAILALQGLVAACIYMGLNALLGSRVQADALAMLLRRKSSSSSSPSV